MKKIFLALVALILVTGCGCSKKEEKKETPKEPNKDLASFVEQTKGGVTVSDLNLNYDGTFTNVYAVIKNTTAEDIEVNDVSIYLYDKDGKQTSEAFCYIGGSLKANSEQICQTSITSNVTKSNKFDFKINK